MSREAVISSSILNNYGFRVLTQGIDITQYQRNPILLWMHNRPYMGRNDEVLPIGRVENLRVDGDQLIGTLVFDSKDDFAKKIEQKWDDGFLKMVSAGLEVIEWSEDPALLVQGQTRATVTKSKLRELSVVDIGANDDALSLSYQGNAIELSADNDQGLEFLSLNTNRMKTIALMLGLADAATEQEVRLAISQLQEDNKTLKTQLSASTDQAITATVNNAIKLRQITEGDREHFVTLGKSVGVDSLTKTLSMMSPSKKPSEMIDPQSPDDYKKLSDVPASELTRLRSDDPERYKKLYHAEYGVHVNV